MAKEIPTGEGLTFEKVWLLFQETDRKFQEMKADTDAELRETARVVREVSKKVGDLGNKLGEFVEGMVRPGLVRLFNERGIPIEQTAQRLEAVRDSQKMEVDLVGVNGDDVIVIEVKSTLGVEDVKEHLHRLEQFRTFFPQYADKQLIGAVAGMVIAKGADRFAYRQGLFVIAQTGETIRLLNDEQFQPKRW